MSGCSKPATALKFQHLSTPGRTEHLPCRQPVTSAESCRLSSLTSAQRRARFALHPRYVNIQHNIAGYANLWLYGR